MKWILFTGTWRLTNSEVERDVRHAVREVLAHGDGIVTGGATGVDFFTLDEAIKMDPTLSRIKVIIPAELESYIEDVYTNWCTPPITKNDVDLLAERLRKIKQVRPEHLTEMPYQIITQKEYSLRNIEEVKISQEVYAFQVNDSPGTQHTIEQAKLIGLPITVHKKYRIDER